MPGDGHALTLGGDEPPRLWIAIAAVGVVAVAAAFFSGCAAGRLLVYVIEREASQTPEALEPFDTPTTAISPTPFPPQPPILILPTATPEPPSPTNTGVVP